MRKSNLGEKKYARKKGQKGPFSLPTLFLDRSFLSRNELSRVRGPVIGFGSNYPHFLVACSTSNLSLSFFSHYNQQIDVLLRGEKAAARRGHLNHEGGGILGKNTNYFNVMVFHITFIGLPRQQILPKWSVSTSGSVSLRFKTNEMNGLLLFNSGGGPGKVRWKRERIFPFLRRILVMRLFISLHESDETRSHSRSVLYRNINDLLQRKKILFLL